MKRMAKKKKAEKERQKADEEWNAAKEWMESLPLPTVYDCLNSKLILFCF